MKQARVSVDQDGIEPQVCIIEVRWSCSFSQSLAGCCCSNGLSWASFGSRRSPEGGGVLVFGGGGAADLICI